MKQYVFTVILAITIIILYHFINVQFFIVDLCRMTRESLFTLRNEPDIDESVILFNVGKLSELEVEEKIDYLLMGDPEKIGINLCHWSRRPDYLIDKYKSDNRIVFVNCEHAETGSLSQIIEEQNTVTHSKTDRLDYFELQLTGFKGRGNEIERINYGPEMGSASNKIELTDLYYWFNAQHIKDKTLLLGYMGDYLTDSIYYYQSCRVTPLNTDYGEYNITPDLYDIEISANIIRTIHHKDFIDEVNQVVRAFVILLISLLNVGILMFTKTKWISLNLIIAIFLLFIFNIAASLLIVFAFDKGYYLQIDELPLVILISTIFTVILNIIEKRSKSK